MTEINHIPSDEATPVQRRGMRNAIFSQCVGTLALTIFSTNLLLLYMAALDIDTARIVLFLSLPLLFDAMIRMPAAWYADRIGVKKVSYIGQVMEIGGMIMITAAGMLPRATAEWVILSGGTILMMGFSLFAAGWFSLLSPIVPETQRGRFFGRLRTSWQAVAIVFVGVCSIILSEESPLYLFQGVFAFATFGLIMRLFFYSRIPELEKPSGKRDSLRAVLERIFGNPGYVSFTCYVFLLSVFTAGCPALFGIIEKRVLNYGDDRITLLGGVSLVGSLIGFFVGGKAVDRWTTKPVFLICHFGYALAILLFLARDLIPGTTLVVLFIVHLAFGFVVASASIAVSTEILALIPPQSKSVASSACLALQRLGTGISGAVSAWALQLGILSESWTIFDAPMTAYDTILLLFGAMVLLLVVTLGLVPSVISKSAWIPRSDAS